jgi:hypothetical protein
VTAWRSTTRDEEFDVRQAQHGLRLLLSSAAVVLVLWRLPRYSS